MIESTSVSDVSSGLKDLVVLYYTLDQVCKSCSEIKNFFQAAAEYFKTVPEIRFLTLVHELEKSALEEYLVEKDKTFESVFGGRLNELPLIRIYRAKSRDNI